MGNGARIIKEERKPISSERVQISQDSSTLGRGSFAVVRYGHLDKIPVAIKVFNSEVDKNNFRNEVLLTSSFQHPNIVNVKGHLEDPRCLIMEYYDQGSLYHLLHENKSFEPSKELIFKFGHDISSALTYIHEKGCIHCDIKPQNVLIGSLSLDAPTHCVITDFGSACVYNPLPVINSKPVVVVQGTAAYTAPELSSNTPPSPACDIFSLGILLWEIWTREVPFAGESVDSIRTAIISQKRPKIPQGLDPVYADLIRRCWDGDPSGRPSAREVNVQFNSLTGNSGIQPSGPLTRYQYSNDLEKDVDIEKTDTPSIEEYLEAIFLQETDLTWTNFSQRIRDRFGASKSEIDVLSTFVAWQDKATGEQMVSRNKFWHILEGFGPIIPEILYRYQTSSSPNTNAYTISEILRIMTSPWFHGYVVPTETEQRLRRQEVGTFLIRFSVKSPGDYTLSLRLADNSPETVGHWLIRKLPGKKYRISGDKPIFDSLETLVTHYSNSPVTLTSGSPAPLLRLACPKSSVGKLERAPGGPATHMLRVAAQMSDRH
eukprot:TRINITY_DN4823_c0_g1_i1.p1 TRINITY_DN4823_c0_g1~~TRINITY_DN4823_c0_g1_i1.p1  ORF type:complete len:545 (+),score=65.65 TRINITY_DN4823_c0_g1_i1:29-1663(+)